MSANNISQRFATFADFYPFYLSQHADVTCRRLHFVGTSVALLLVAAAVMTGRYWLFGAAVVSVYSFAWFGHFVFERNRPATFKYPFYSLAGDFVMARDILLGRIPW